MPAVIPLTRAQLEKYAGQWVVVKDEKVAFASPTPEEAFRWAAANGIDPERDLVFAVPTGPAGWFF